MEPDINMLNQISKKNNLFDSLNTKGSDREDFKDCAVWNIKQALIDAYDRGLVDGVANHLNQLK